MYPKKKGCVYNIKWFLTLAMVGVGILGSILVWTDATCRSNIETWMPYYPNATEVSVEYNVVRPRAYGTTFIKLFSPDDEETVRQFYRDNTLALMQADTLRGLAITNWQVEPNPDGDGVFIHLFSTCGE